ncbi:MAG TPA: hypothetical protein VH814_07625 [Steroidobacteraceae bacterium]
MRGLVAVAVAAVGLLNGCGTRDSTAMPGAGTTQAGFAAFDKVVLYRHDFSDGPGGWHTVMLDVDPSRPPANALACFTEGIKTNCYVPVNTVDGHMLLESPWFHDPNHAPPGAGYLSLLTFVYLRGFAGADTAQLPELDLRGLLLRVSMKTEHLDVKEGSLYFWFQMLAPDGKWVNYAYTARPLNVSLRDEGFTEVRLRFISDPGSWTCLGSSEVRADFYGCIPLEEAMSHVNGDFGFVILPVNENPLEELQPSGKIALQWIELSAGGPIVDPLPDL